MTEKTKEKRLPFSAVIAGLVLILSGLFCISFLLRQYTVSPKEVVKILISGIIPIEQTWTDTMRSVVMDVRIPRILMALAVGAGLSVSGAAFQGVFRNPLVSPDIMGVSSAAGFGAALGISLSLGASAVRGTAFLSGVAGVAAAYLLSRVHKTSPTVMLVLSGIVVSALFEASISILKYMADPEEKLPAITFWLMGSLSSTRWEHVRFALPLIGIGTAALMAVSWKINLLSLGDAEARSLGVRTERLKTVIILSATLVTATCVCVSGIIRWVGLLIPHVARMMVGPDHRRLIPASALLGGAYLLLIDDLTRTVSEASIPLGIMTSIVGAPFFAILLRKTKGEWSR